VTDLADRALEVLLDDKLADIVDVVLAKRDGLVEAHARDGMVSFTRAGVVATRGRNPLQRQDPSELSPLRAELANVRPAQSANVYPFAYDNAAQLFEHASAPDLAVVHTPAHNWEERGGHRGEHGSLDLVQSRAPLIVAGCGVKRLGRIERAARMIDVAPTLARLAGVEGPLRAQDGAALDDVIEHAAKRVVAFLWDGSNANVLYDMAAAGELPNVTRLMEMGTTFGHGLIASFPSVTLANHTTALTGAHPGRHGVLHNYFYDRAAARQIKTNEPDTWHLARDEISPGVETVFEAVARSGGGFTAAIDEPADRGASYATFDLVRAAGGAGGGALAAALSPDDVPGATQEFVQRKREFGWASSADNLAVQQVEQLAAGALGNPAPRFMWINLILPDAANHAGGPYSDIGHAGLRDTDRRFGRIMDALDWGAGETAFVLLADHGMEDSDPNCTGDFDEALRRADIPFRDEGYGFVYLG
jgi:predicted AlkP superfamily pyrophosphatase or phosphodiesterase